MNKRNVSFVLAIALLILSVCINFFLLLKLCSYNAGKSMVEFYGAIGSDKAIGIIKEPLLIEVFGKDWRDQRLYEKTTSTSRGIYESNFSPIPRGTSPILVSPESSESHYQLYSLDKKICCGLDVDFKKKSVKWYAPMESARVVEEILPNGQLRLIPPQKKELSKELGGK